MYFEVFVDYKQSAFRLVDCELNPFHRNICKYKSTIVECLHIICYHRHFHGSDIAAVITVVDHHALCVIIHNVYSCCIDSDASYFEIFLRSGSSAVKHKFRHS